MVKNKIVLLVHYSKYSEMLKKLSETLNEDSFKILCHGTEAEKILLDFVGHERPVGVVMDPTIGEPHLGNICKSVFDTIGTFDMPCRIYALKDIIDFPGVTVITEEDIPSILA